MCSKGIQKCVAAALARSTRTSRRLGPWVLLALTAAAWMRPTPSQAQTTPLLLGGDVPRARRAVALDARLPPGELRTDWDGIRLTASDDRRTLESPLYPVAVRASSKSERSAALSLLERAYESAWLTHGAAPRTGIIRWELDEAAQEIPPRRLPLLTTLRTVSVGADRALPICRGGVIDETSAHSCVIEALLLGASPSSARALARGYSTFERFALTGRAPQEPRLRHPAHALVTRDAELSPVGSALFFAALAERSAQPAADIGFLALALSRTITPPGARRWNAEPDVLDILRTNLGEDRENYARFFDRLSVARFVPLSGLEAIEALQGGRAMPAWSVSLESLPRNLTLTDPLGPTGSAAFELVTAAPTEATIAFRIDCEAPVTYAWSVVRLSSQGEVLTYHPIPYQETSPRADQRIEIQNASKLLLIGTNLGGVDLDHPYDPDHSPHEAHSCSVYLAKIS